MISDNEEKLQRYVIEGVQELGRKGMEINVMKSKVMRISKTQNEKKKKNRTSGYV